MPGGKEPVKLIVRIQPNARENAMVSFQEDVLRVKIAAPPVDGKANRALIAFLSEVLEISKSSIVIVKGETAKRKVVSVTGISKAQVLEQAASHSSAIAPRTPLNR